MMDWNETISIIITPVINSWHEIWIYRRADISKLSHSSIVVDAHHPLPTLTVSSLMVGFVSIKPVDNSLKILSLTVFSSMCSTILSNCWRSFSLVARSVELNIFTTHGRTCCWYSASFSSFPILKKNLGQISSWQRFLIHHYPIICLQFSA